MPWTIRIALITAGVLLTVSAVGLWTTRPADVGARPTKLRLGVLPGLSPDELQRIHQPLVDHLSRRTGIPCELVIPADYDDLIARFGRGEVDLAWLGAFTFTLAHERFGAIPLAMRNEDARFTTVFIVHRENADTPLEEFKGRRLAFGNKRSTSGHLMARHHLIEEGWQTEDFKNAHYHPTHDATAYHVRDKKADLGALNSLHLKALYESGKLSSDDVVVLNWSSPYVDYVWVAQPSLRSDVFRLIREALLELDPLKEEDARILESAQCTGYRPARLDDFARVRKIATDLQLLDAD